MMTISVVCPNRFARTAARRVWTWEPDRIEPEVGPVQIKFADVRDVAAGCST